MVMAAIKSGIASCVMVTLRSPPLTPRTTPFTSNPRGAVSDRGWLVPGRESACPKHERSIPRQVHHGQLLNPMDILRKTCNRILGVMHNTLNWFPGKVPRWRVLQASTEKNKILRNQVTP